MELVDDRTLSTLEELIKANIDRLESYERAQRDAEDGTLKTLFGEHAAQSARFRTELSAELSSLGGRVPEDSSFSGVMQQAWMEFKAGLSGNDREILLDSCEQSENTILSTYRRVLDEVEPPLLPTSVRQLVARQADELLEARTRIHTLRSTSQSIS